MAKFYIGNKEVSASEYINFLEGDTNVVDIVEKEEIKVKTESEEFFEELTQIVGFSFKRANKVLEVFKTKNELVGNLDKLPFSEIENKTLIDFYKASSKKERTISKKEKVEKKGDL
jgi:hypothetical protein